jgi:ubiquinol-cytochrome c reductase cytochrome c subunit
VAPVTQPQAPSSPRPRGVLPRDLWRAGVAGLLVAIATFGLTLPVVAQTEDGADDGGDVPVDEAELYVRGGEVFQANCAACHGTRAEGGPGPGVLAGPRIDDTDIAYWDLTVRTGRMPITAPSVGIRDDLLTEEQREALAVYAAQRFDLPGEIVEVESGDASRGQEIYVRNCAACHGAAAGGGISGANVTVPPLTDLDGVAIHQGTRVGPFEMPAFDAAVLSDDDIADMVGYLDLVNETPRTAAGVREVDQITAALYAVALGVLAAVVILVVARARRWYPRDPEGFHTAPPFEPRS